MSKRRTIVKRRTQRSDLGAGVPNGLVGRRAVRVRA